MTTAEQDAALIQVRGLTKTYGLMPVLRGLNVDIQRGESVALLGSNGSGKSTFMRIISGLSKPTGGVITVGGWELPREAAAVRAQIGMVAHKPLLYENLTALENLRFFARLYYVPNAEPRIQALLAQVGLARRAHDLVRTFSRGMLQRLAIARALLHEPEVLLFDEPHTGLDQEAAAMLDLVVTEQRAAGRTVLMATHELERAARLSSRILILARGAISGDVPSAGMSAAEVAALYAEKASAR
jgi:heme ABC exporter ATP-binding subunit CcmA